MVAPTLTTISAFCPGSLCCGAQTLAACLLSRNYPSINTIGRWKFQLGKLRASNAGRWIVLVHATRLQKFALLNPGYPRFPSVRGLESTFPVERFQRRGNDAISRLRPI